MDGEERRMVGKFSSDAVMGQAFREYLFGTLKFVLKRERERKLLLLPFLPRGEEENFEFLSASITRLVSLGMG